MDYETLAEWLFPEVTETPEDMEKRYPVRGLPEGAVVSRLAPSPTGFVHLGNVVQGLTSERLAHQSGGVLFLRIEDTDAKREVKGASEILIEMLSHYGIVFDEGASLDENGAICDKGDYGPYKQSNRAPIYHVYAKKLVREGKAYPCFCTEEDLDRFHAEQEAEKANFGYYGKWAKWRDRSLEEIREQLDSGTPWVLRFRSTGSIEHKFKYNDLIKGEVDITENDIDHVLLKSDGIPTYHFAHAVDDHLMRTTHVVRGDEWLSGLPFHIQLFQALGFRLPKYVHIGTLMKMDGTSKRKLSKRKDPELALSYYKSVGYPTDSVVEYLMTILNSNFEDWRRANPLAPLDDFKFSAKKMNAAGSLFDLAKLSDVSKNLISRMSAEDVYNAVSEWAKEFDGEFYDDFTREPAFTKAVLAIGRGGNKPRKDFATWSEVKGYMGFMFDRYYEANGAYPDGFDAGTIADILTDFLSTYSSADDQTVWFDKMKDIAEKHGFARETKEYKASPEAYRGHIGDISAFVRVAVTGKQNSPDLYAVMSILGHEVATSRIQKQIERLRG
ncbi:MAG: glutamate--tRNA ligase [Ruminococcus sp.]|nr:glutamate--tRNA ligase [Candidatus Apopatosoma intestinale]